MAKGQFKRTLKWQPGDLFGVPLRDGSFAIAQAIAPVRSFAIDFALLSTRCDALPVSSLAVAADDVLAVRASWRTVVTGGHWARIGTIAPLIDISQCPNQRLISAGSAVGVTHSDWGLLEDFLSACHGLLPWNVYPAFDFDSYLLDGVARPQKAKVLS